MKTGVELIAEERQRQIYVLGYDADFVKAHPEYYENEQLAVAGACYAYPDNMSYPGRAEEWPWGLESFHETPNDRVKELSKAGALIAAEIDRLNNMTLPKSSIK